jgi:hypothetical protein
MASPNPSFDTIASATLSNYKRKLVENVMGFNVLLWQLQEKGFRGVEQGGRTIVHPIMYATNSTARSYRGYDMLDTTPQEGFTSAELPWKYLAISITISGQEEAENQGSKTQIFNLLEGKIKQAELSLRLEVNRQLWGDGSGNGGKDITGLDLAVEDGTAWSTYAGINSSSTIGSFWRNQYIDAGGATFGTTAGKSTVGIAKWRTMYNNCTLSSSKPTLILTTQDLMESYEANIEGDKLRLTDTKLGEAGFANLTYKGVPIVFDEDCPANTTFFLNSEYIKLITMKGRNFETTPFMRPQNQDAKVAQILWAGNLLTFKRDQQGRVANLLP